MARFVMHGFEELNDAFAKCSKIDTGTTRKILQSMGDALAGFITENARKMLPGPYFTGQTALAVFRKNAVVTQDGGSVKITFRGSRSRNQSDHGRNAEIAFINEFGKHGQPARPFISRAVQEHEAEICDLGQAELDRFLANGGL